MQQHSETGAPMT